MITLQGKIFEEVERIKEAGKSRPMIDVANIENNRGLMSYHKIINYRGDLIDVKVPKSISPILLGLQVVGAFFFGGRSIVTESLNECIDREAAIYKRLHDAGFPTFEPMQHLLYAGDIRLVKGVLLTKRVHNAIHPANHIADWTDSMKEAYAAEIFGLMKLLYEEHGELWMDAGVKNTLYTVEKRMLYDFGLKPNPKIEKNILQIRSLESFCFSLMHYGNMVPEIIASVFSDSYSPDKDFKVQMNSRFSKYLRSPSKVKCLLNTSLYFEYSKGLDYSQVNDVRVALLRTTN